MAPFPDFASRAVFPSFESLPTAGPDGTSVVDDYFLLGQVKEDMTITKPTLILGDRDGASFALVFDGLGREDLDFKKLGLKKGSSTAVVRRAVRVEPADETKRGFVRVEGVKKAERSPLRDETGEWKVWAIPGPLGTVVELGGLLAERDRKAREREQQAEPALKKTGCDACGKADDKPKACTGCDVVKYCSKVSYCHG